MTTAEIEAALASSWTLDNLAVYGDYLMSLGDPRGELIAVDVHLARHGSSPEVLHRRRRAIRSWLGLTDAVDPTRGAWEGVRFAFGFIDDLRVELATRILQSPAGPYVRGVTLTHKHTTASSLLAELAAAPRPWLDRLTITPRFKGVPATAVWHAGPPILENAPTDALIAATPRLTRLELAGHRMLAAFPHPRVTSLRIDGVDAFLPILEPGPPMPAVTELELAFARGPGCAVVMQRPWPPLVPVESFPALRRLDLAGNHALRATTDTQVGVFDVLPSIGVLEQLVELRLPAVRTTQEAAVVRKVVRKMPALRRLEIVGGAGKHRFDVEIVETEALFPEWSSGPAIGPLWVRCGKRVYQVAPRDVIQMCERSFRWFDAATREAWTVFWHTVGAMALSNIAATMPSVTLRIALEALGFLDASFPALRKWDALRDELRELADDSEVRLSFDPATV